MDRTFVRTCSLLLSLLAIVTSGQPFDFPSPPSRSPGLQLDRDGRIYSSAGNQLYRLNSNLVQEDSWTLRTDAVNISLSSDGRWLVVCLTDLSCEVYNANNFSAGYVFRRENVIISVDNFALFAAEDSFYVGGITIDGTGAQDQIILRRYGFAGSQTGVEESGSYTIDRDGFIRNFYGGFVRGRNAYYFVIDNNPSAVRSVRVMRVCHNSDFNALYELTLSCGIAPNSNSRIGGVSVAENFAGTTGATVILSRSQQQSTSRNFVCPFDLDMIDNIMDGKFNICNVATGNTLEAIDLAWQMAETSCNDFMPSQDNCQFNTPSEVPRALDDIANLRVTSGIRIDLGATNQNFITASVAVTIGNFSFVFAAYTSNSGEHFVTGFDLESTSATLMESNGFDRRAISDGPVTQLQWAAGMNFISASTFNSVMQIPIANCSLSSNCMSCLGNGNPLCGWCVVENKCSQESECRNPETRWIRAAGTNTDQCTTISISPQQFDLDAPEILTLTLSQPLPPLLVNETYLCHFASDGVSFMVDAVGSGTTYTCNVTGEVPSEVEGLSKAVDVSLASSLLGIPFSTNPGALTIFQCSSAKNCSQCLQTNSPCGWCVYNKVCSGTATPCINETENFLRPSMNQDYTDVCPLLDRPTGGGENYLQPVQVARNIELVTRNLPPEISGFMYVCYVNGERLSATYNNESSLTCAVNTGQLTLPGGVSQRMVTVVIQWMEQNSGGRNINHTIDILTMPTQVLLYNCLEVADGCSSCIGMSLTNGFECGWCDRPSGMTDTCSFTGDCSPPQNLAITGSQCPMPTITDFNPKFGPPEGGTTIIITGTDLGVSFSDFAEDSIQVGGVNCIPEDSDGYEPGRRINCTTTNSTVSTAVEITLSNGAASSGQILFTRVSPRVTGVFPPRGPQAGGTNLTVYGTNLNIGNTVNTTITLVGGTQCIINRASINATSINCITMAFTASDPPGPMSGAVMVMIDNAQVTNSSVQYSYTLNPEFYNVIPSTTILGGGIELIFNGTNLDVVQRPMLEVSDPNYVDATNTTLCQVLNSTAISCVTPPLDRIEPGDVDGITYTIRVDAASGPDLENNVSLRISVLPNPSNFTLIDTEYNIGSNTLIRIMGENLGSVSDDDYVITVGGQRCLELSVQRPQMQINCEPPPDPPSGMNEATVIVSVGRFINETLPTKLTYVGGVAPSDPLPLEIIIPVIAGGLVAVALFFILIICCVVCYHRRKSKKNEQRWTNLLSQMELMELEMADECKRAFTELQTDLADLVQISDANLPYRDFRSFAMRFLFPQAGSDHAVLLPLQLPEKTDQDKVVENLKSFQSLIMDKKFLLVFVHTLEGQGGRFTLQDKCSVASLLMVAFQNDLDYATDVLQTLLSELMRKSLNNKSHPKLLLRRTESVAEKMLANWLAFLLFPYLLDNVGQPLFTLFRAIKSQLEKGPVDIITGEARHSLSEEKLLRQHIEVKPVEGVVEPESGDDIPIKMLDCDSITQAKEKVIDTLYKNCPASKRPQLTEVDLILQCGTASLTLRDQDHTNKREGDVIKINTLGSYNVDEMSQKHQNNPRLPIPRFKLEKRIGRPDSGGSYDTLGTIIANIGVESRGNMMTSGELSHVFHLVRTEADEGDDVEKRGGKIMSEVFLTRLLSTKRILQPYVDAVFDSIFTVSQGRSLPKAIKSLFDFLDLQASELGIQDPEILHTWKTNSVPLRFWVNVIKNPDFVFDIHKSATVDSCLTVIAQAYIDACSTAELKYSKDTPSARLLYVNEVKKYKQDVQQYYNSVQSQPKLSQYEMGEYLRETAQVCANSVEQVEPDITSDSQNLGPASMTRQLYFVQESALYELFKFAVQYSEEITDGLNEEGLSIMASNFQQLKSSIPV